jgi:GNAT superfamily N-acetyltransferase
MHRQGRRALSPARAAPSLHAVWNEGLCRRGHDGPAAVRISLSGRHKTPSAFGAMNIRTAINGDSARLAQLSGVLGYPVSPEVMAERLHRVLARAEDVIFVAEEPQPGVMGWIHGTQRDTLESDLRCEILGLVVDSTHRNRGVGRALVVALEQWAAARGLEEVAVRSNVTRIESHPFYERLGYVRVKTSHIYRKSLLRSGPS